jgi:hypothetical protein
MQLTRTFPEIWRLGSVHIAGHTNIRALFLQNQQNAGAVTFSTPRRFGASAGYQVTTGKTLILSSLFFHNNAYNDPVSIGYSDSDRGFGNLADGANPVNMDSTAADGKSALNLIDPGPGNPIPIYYEIPAGKYPRVVMVAGSTLGYFQLYGVEL